jgi:hypothetical protein
MVVHWKELKDVLYRLLKMSTHGGRHVGI